MRGAILFFFCIMLVPLAYAGDAALTFKDKGATLTDSIAYVVIDGIDVIDYVPADGVLSMSLDRGEHHMQVILDDPMTRGNDHAGSFTIVQKDFVESDIVLFAVGSVRGFAVDWLDNALPSANISLSCTTPPPLDVPGHADAFGAFFIKAAPVGPCRILARHDGLSGHVDIDIEKGGLADVTIRLVPPKKEMDRTMVFLILLAGLVLLLVLLRVINGTVSKKEKTLWRRGERIKKEQKTTQEGGKPNSAASRVKSRSEDILETLAKEERRITEHLLSHKNVSTQAALRHDLGITRTTMGRLLRRLEAKNIITTRKVGKSVRVELTDWFLGRE